MTPPLRIAILGSTGSIGRQALDVAARFPERVEVVALAAGTNVLSLAEQATAFGVRHVAIAEPALLEKLSSHLPGSTVSGGDAAVVELATLPEVDLVLNALVGAAGLRASVATLTAGKRLALANKESLVVGGELVTSLATYPNALIPVDSEHSAIFQCLLGEPATDVSRIWLTASGGPFRGRDRASLSRVTVAEALAHPRWTMGPKITIDSSTLMNKGLEAIEAHHLFAVGYDIIRIVVHPQSCVHSMVEFADGSVKAHLGATDMRIPIQYALSHPERWDSPVPPVDFAALGQLDFEEPDRDAFPALSLALEAGRLGGTMPAAMNAANEIAVAAFLRGDTGFMDIPRVVETVMAAHTRQPLESIEAVESVDAWARAVATEAL
ncbi:MAG: 1-deoxy-D-xylulose-5-phosphate reductoisomerase [Actinobacteria bacterium]|nr:MAG: 1-deoxy-D-xylulose-5-phosphate reductoisomerase [Actinomycetota bacterium]